MKTEIKFTNYTSYIHVHIYINTYMYKCIYIHIHICVCVVSGVVYCGVCVCVCVCTRMCAFKSGELITRALNTRENSFIEKKHFQVKD